MEGAKWGDLVGKSGLKILNIVSRSFPNGDESRELVEKFLKVSS